MSLQSKMQKATSSYARKVFDTHIHHIGQQSNLVRISIISDKYGDSDYTITANEDFTGYLNFPGGELPITSGTDNTDTTQNNIHIYNLLPIELYTKHETELKEGDIILHKVRTNVNLETSNSDAFRILSLQVVDQIAKFNGVELMWNKFIVAPYTLNVNDVDGLQDILDTVLAEDWIEE